MTVAPDTKLAAEAWEALAEWFFTHGRPVLMRAGHQLALSPPQAMVLRALLEPRPMGDLAALMHCDSSNMTGLVDRLEERGLVRRTVADHDRRVKLIALTGAGRDLRAELLRLTGEPPAALVALCADDQRALRDILGRAHA